MHSIEKKQSAIGLKVLPMILKPGKAFWNRRDFLMLSFFGHLAIEKALKALVVKESGEHAPYSHSLVILAQKANIELTVI